MNEGDSQRPSLAEIIEKSLLDFLKNDEGVPSFETIRRQKEMTGEKGKFTPLKDAFNEAFKDREKSKKNN